MLRPRKVVPRVHASRAADLRRQLCLPDKAFVRPTRTVVHVVVFVHLVVFLHQHSGLWEQQ